MKILLCSSSPRRREILARAGVDFQICAPENAEELRTAPDLRELPRLNALAKERSVRLPKNFIALGCDTVVWLDGAILGKPRDLNEAREFLRRLSGRTHEILSGVALRSAKSEKSFTVVTRVTFKTLAEETIACYLERTEVLDKAGAYALQEHGDMLVERVDGDRDNVVGLPLERILAELQSWEQEQ